MYDMSLSNIHKIKLDKTTFEQQISANYGMQIFNDF